VSVLLIFDTRWNKIKIIYNTSRDNNKRHEIACRIDDKKRAIDNKKWEKNWLHFTPHDSDVVDDDDDDVSVSTLTNLTYCVIGAIKAERVSS